MSKIFIFVSLALILNSIQNAHCQEKKDELCISCEIGYYLDKSSENECKNSYLVPIFHNCNETEDGISCSTCNNGYYFAQNGECVNTKKL